VTELRHRLWALYMVVNFRIAYNNGSFLTNWKNISFSSRTALYAVSKVINHIKISDPCLHVRFGKSFERQT
jgi:hypothetical protein